MTTGWRLLFAGAPAGTTDPVIAYPTLRARVQRDLGESTGTGMTMLDLANIDSVIGKL